MNIQTCKLISSMQSIICMSNTQPIQSTQGNCIKDIKSNKGTRVKYLNKCITLTTSTKLQSMGTNSKYLIRNINLEIINIGLFYLLLKYSPFNQALSSPIIYSPYHHHLLFFFHGIASPHILLAFFEFGPVEFGEK